MRRIRLGMVGGGEGSFIGAVHRIAARIDNQFELLAGALSSDGRRAGSSAAALGIMADRSYASFEDMARTEAARDDGIEAVAIVTPNHLHAAPTIAFLNAGIHVICDKPLAATMAQAKAMKAASDESKAQFFLTHNYTGYPLIRQAREMVASGALGSLRVAQVEYAQDWLAEPVEATGNKQASWRTDPARAGAGAIGDIGTHAFNLLGFVISDRVASLAADIQSFVDGRQVDDNAQIMLRFQSGARGSIWASQVAVGAENSLRLRLYGDKASLDWSHDNPNEMIFARLGEPRQILTRGGAGLGDGADRWTRVPPGHPEGYLEGFANLYQDIASVLMGKAGYSELPSIEAGMDGMWFITACQDSARRDAAWVLRDSDAS